MSSERTAGLLALSLTISAPACAPSYAAGYQEALDRGLAAENAGRYEEAAKKFNEAASLGDRYKDRDEARLLEAESYERLGRFADADATYARIVKEGGGRYQAVRAEFWRARLITRWKGQEAGDALMLAAVQRNPSSGLARHAMRRMLGPIEDRDGPDRAIGWLTALEPYGKGTDLEEEIAYEKGLVLFRAGRLEAARDVFVKSARAHVYPHGSLTDDAFYQASLLEEQLGHPDQAIALLQEMQKPREAAYTGSSYERPRFPQAQLRIARLYRDQKHDPLRARREFRKLCTDHSASRLCDDALWEEAELEKAANDADVACESMHLLLQMRPDSRYAACAHALCASIEEDAKCHDYLVRGLTAPAQREEIGEPDPDEETRKKPEPSPLP